MEGAPSPCRLCQFCAAESSAAATHCSACGKPLNLLLCANCGAVNNKNSTACHHCSGLLLTPADESLTDEAVPDDGPRPKSRSRSKAIGVTLAAALVVGLGCYAYSQLSNSFATRTPEQDRTRPQSHEPLPIASPSMNKGMEASSDGACAESTRALGLCPRKTSPSQKAVPRADKKSNAESADATPAPQCTSPNAALGLCVQSGQHD
jgi:hypothetical protein